MRPAFLSVSHRVGAPTAAPVHGLINGTVAPHSPWQSPVPYLFGGLAAMLGLVAFALLISPAPTGSSPVAGDADGEKGSASRAPNSASDFQEHVVVIMAGDKRPMFLVKPVTSRAAEVELAAAASASSIGRRRK